jgi:aspartokinase-like uncharacterized kinase
MLTIVKIGGSLFDWPDLGPRLATWLQNQTRRILLVPGGGVFANVIRDLDRRHHLGEEISHWLALRTMTLNGFFLQSLLAVPLVAHPLENETAKVAIVDALPFVQADEGRAGCLPHSWSVTSDSVAARVAVVAGADRLILLKSVTIPTGLPWDEAGRQNYVDAHFAAVIMQAPRLEVSTLNFRKWHPFTPPSPPTSGERAG